MQVTLAVFLSAAGCAYFASKVSGDELAGTYHDSGQEVLGTVAEMFGDRFRPERLGDAEVLRGRIRSAVAAHPDVSSAVVLWPDPRHPHRLLTTSEKPPAERLERVARQVLARGHVEGSDIRNGRLHYAERVTPLEWDGRPVAALALNYDLGRYDRALSGRTRRITLVLAALLLMFTAFTAFVLGRGIFQPLEGLRRATQEIRSGKLWTRLGWTRGDELGVLAADFDAMARELEEQHRLLEALALTDPLTGLANHRHLQEVLVSEIERAERDGRPLSVALFDIDRFKQVNDLHGHPLGDRLLALVGDRIAEAVEGIGLPARLGGDEFAIVLPDTDETRAKAACERALRSVRAAPIEAHSISCSVGYALYPEDANNAPALLQLADGALYWAKRSGRGCIRRYHPEHVFVVTEEQRAEFAAVVEKPGMVSTVFQPIVALATGDVVGYEALSRFVDDRRRLPSWWFGQAHRFGLGHRLEAQAVRRALSTPERPPGSFLSVNVSPSALSSAELDGCLPDDLSEVVVEITEHEQIGDEEGLQHALDPLRGRGVTVAIDDAGAGYASLRQVMLLHAELVKLDRGLVEEVDCDPTKAALVSSLVDFANHTDATLCAEGIETAEELMTLRELGVTWGQGYFLANPGPAWPDVRPEALALLQEASPEPRLKARPGGVTGQPACQENHAPQAATFSN